MSNFDHIYLASVSDGIWERTKLNLASNRTARKGVITNDRNKLVIICGHCFYPWLDTVVGALSKEEACTSFQWSFDNDAHGVIYGASMTNDAIILHEPKLRCDGDSYVTRHFVTTPDALIRESLHL